MTRLLIEPSTISKAYKSPGESNIQNSNVHEAKLFENKNINEDYFFFVDDWMINFDTSLKKIYNHFDVKTLKGFGISDNSLGVISASMILHYLEDSHKKRLVHIKKINPINNKSFLLMTRFLVVINYYGI